MSKDYPVPAPIMATHLDGLFKRAKNQMRWLNQKLTSKQAHELTETLEWMAATSAYIEAALIEVEAETRASLRGDFSWRKNHKHWN